jgi:transposase-like protein
MAPRYSSSTKSKVVLEVMEEDRSVTQVARDYDIHPNTVRNWLSTFKENASEVFDQNGEVKELKEEVRQLRELLGTKEREIALLKNFLGQPD